MAQQTVLYEVKDHIATITLNRPGARNALNQAMLEGLKAALTAARDDGQVHVVVLTGAGDRAFCAGGDIGGLAEARSPVEQHQARGDFVDLFRMIPRLGKPVIAAVNGHALGGGLGLVLASDLAIAAERATFGTPEVNVGVFPMIVMAGLIRNVGRKTALELILTGERVSAQEAVRMGLINRAVPDEEFQAAVADLAARVSRHSPLVLRLGRDAFYRMVEMDYDDALDYLQTMLTLNLLTEDAQEGLRAFLEKRQPVWKGR